MSEELRKIKVSSGNIQVEMEVTQEAYSAYMRPWWEMKQKAKRNRDAIEQKGYSIQSYEEWQDGSYHPAIPHMTESNSLFAQ